MLDQPVVPFVYRRKNYDSARRSPDAGMLAVIKNFVETEISQFLDQRPGAQILDVGCGGQPFRGFIETQRGVYTGCDVQQNIDGTVDFLLPIDTHSAIPQAHRGKYDVLLCSEVLEHVADLKKAFQNTHGFLKQGGVVILTTPFIYPLHEEPADYFRITPHLLESLASETGFRIKKVAKGGTHADVLTLVLGSSTFHCESTSLLAILCRKMASSTARILSVLLALKNKTKPTVSGPFYLSNLAVIQKI